MKIKSACPLGAAGEDLSREIAKFIYGLSQESNGRTADGDEVVDIRSASLDSAALVSPFIRSVARTMNRLTEWCGVNTRHHAHCVPIITFVEPEPVQLRPEVRP
jgi:hypothetical protein